MAVRQLSIDQARRIALGAQGFGRSRPDGRIDRRHLRRLLADIGIIQIDSVNVLVRSQELPLFARLGAHSRDLIPDATANGELFEYWVHEACHVPTDQHHLYRWRMAQLARSKGWRQWELEHSGLIDDVHRHVAENGPVVTGDLRDGQRAPGATWWDWDDGKIALESLFRQGRLTATRRQRDFARLYDLPERVLPADVLATPTPPEPDARKQLLMLAARYYGVATDKDLADYHRQNLTTCRALIAELVEDGRLEPVEVEGWGEPTYLHPGVRCPRSVGARALLSPFDPVVWYRDRAERLFDFHYRIEIYTPAAKRQYGYYVLPFLLDNTIVGRVDLKADRAASNLLVQSAWIEPGHDPAHIASELEAELYLMASWLELDRVVTAGRGNLTALRLRR